MNLLDTRIRRNDRRDQRRLERPSRRYHVPGVDGALRGLDRESRPALVPSHRGDLDAGTNRRPDRRRVCLEVVRDLLLGDERLRVTIELQTRKPVVPGGAVRDERVPASRAPFLGDPVAFEDEVRHAGVAQVLADRHSRLTAADDDHLNLFDAHAFPSAGTGAGRR